MRWATTLGMGLMNFDEQLHGIVHPVGLNHNPLLRIPWKRGAQYHTGFIGKIARNSCEKEK